MKAPSPRPGIAVFPVILLALTGAVGNRAGAAPQAQIAPVPSRFTPEQWGRDLDALAAELPRLHTNAFARLPKESFQSSLVELKAALPGLSPSETLAGALKLVASLGDSHTTLGYRPRAALPLMISWLDDGFWVRNATAAGEALLNGRLESVDGRSIEEVASALAALIPHENEAQVRNHLPGLLTDPFVLNGLGITERPDAARLTVRDAAGRIFTADLKAMAVTEKPAWLVDMAAENAAVLYLKNRAKDYWYEILPESQTLYFQYNACRNMPSQPFAVFVQELFQAADRSNAERLIIDLRHNGGGNSEIFSPFLARLAKHQRLNRRRRLFVLIGRRTFSSAILNAVDLKRRTAALFAGEPTGGKPNHFGEVRWFKLPASGLAVTYSTKFFRQVEGDPASFEPDIRVPVNFADQQARRDPVLEAVLAYGR